MLCAISVDELANWPVLDEDVEHSVTVWMEMDENFCGERIAVKFPRIPGGPGLVEATNTPIDVPIIRPRPHRFFGRSHWIAKSSTLWSEPEGGVLLADGPFVGGAVWMYPGDTFRLTKYTLRVTA